MKNWTSIIKQKRCPLIKNWDTFEENCNKTNFKILSGDYILKTIKNLLTSLVPKIIIQVGASKILLKKLLLKVVLVIGSSESGVIALNLIAKQKGAYVIELQHGYITNTNISYRYFLPNDYREIKPLPDKILVYGDASKDIIIERSENVFSQDDVKVIANPRLGSFLRNKLRKSKSIRIK